MLRPPRARRVMRSNPFRVLCITLTALLYLLISALPAFADDALVSDSRTLFLTDRVTPTKAPARYTKGERPERVVALRGEREGFQFALRNTSGSTLDLRARIIGDEAFDSQVAAGAISYELLRVGFVKVPRTSTGLRVKAGLYADPLPQQTDAPGGGLRVANGQWGAVAPIFKIATNAAAGRYNATLELTQGDTVYARTAFTLDIVEVFDKQGKSMSLLQPGAPGAMKTVLGVEGDAYWLGHDGHRNGASHGYPTQANRMAQLQGLMAYLGDRGVTPLEMPLANPSKKGTYRECNFGLRNKQDAPPTVNFAQQLTAYLATGSFPVRVLPHRTNGCNNDKHGDENEATRDVRGTGEKQDDVINKGFQPFMTTVYNEWRRAGWLGAKRNTYVKHPFDEPGDATAAQRATMDKQVPAATTAIRRATQNRVSIFSAQWPRDNRKTKACKVLKGKRSCATVQRDDFSNHKQWDGKGLDDPDVWVPPFSRLYGRTDNPHLVRHGYKRGDEYRKRLAGIKKLPGGREVWAYNFFTATPYMPQLSIDAAGTDARFQYWLLAREGHTGLYVSNSMMGWSSGTDRHKGSSLLRKGDPYKQALYFHHNQYGYAAGWGTFIYPGFRPELGLSSEELRNTAESKPVTSLRMEGMRDGAEDANLATMYRDRFGGNRALVRMRSIVPERMCNKLPASLGNVVFPCYSNANMSQRMEAVRRAMIRDLARRK